MERPGSVKRVLVVARSAVARAGLESLLARSGDFVVVGAAEWHPGDGLTEAEPELVLLALDPGDEPPLPLALPPDAAARAPAVVVLGDEPLDRWAPRALRQGAGAVLPLSASAEEIVAALDAATAGLVAMPRSLVGSQARTGAVPGAATPPAALSPREAEILGLLASGLGNKTIAARLGISEHTVKSHVMALFGKLGVSTRAEAVAAGVRLGILML
jgi:two-component system, NarL family, response regulator YdfI